MTGLYEYNRLYRATVSLTPLERAHNFTPYPEAVTEGLGAKDVDVITVRNPLANNLTAPE